MFKETPEHRALRKTLHLGEKSLEALEVEIHFKQHSLTITNRS